MPFDLVEVGHTGIVVAESFDPVVVVEVTTPVAVEAVKLAVEPVVLIVVDDEKPLEPVSVEAVKLAVEPAELFDLAGIGTVELASEIADLAAESVEIVAVELVDLVFV